MWIIMFIACKIELTRLYGRHFSKNFSLQPTGIEVSNLYFIVLNFAFSRGDVKYDSVIFL